MTKILIAIFTLLMNVGTVCLPSEYFEFAEYANYRLVNWYERNNGVFIGHLSNPADWCRANSLNAFCDHLIYKNVSVTAVDNSPESHDDKLWNILKDIQDNQADNFYQTADYFDDILWWCLGYSRAYQVAINRNDTGRADKFKATAISIHDVVTKDSCMYNVSNCNGGCYWSRDYSYKNAITNELYFSASTALALITGDATYITIAEETLQWILDSGMLNEDNLFVDGLDHTTCVPGGGIYTYNQGVILSGLAALQTLTVNKTDRKKSVQMGNESIDYIAFGEKLIISVMSHMTNMQGILVESGCGDGGLFKGIFCRHLRYFMDMSNTVYNDKYVKFLKMQFDSLWSVGRDTVTGLFQSSWGESYAEVNYDHNLQVSGIDLINSLSGIATEMRIPMKSSELSELSVDSCGFHGTLLNSVCYCDERFTGTACEVETSYLDYYSGQSVTLSSVQWGRLLCSLHGVHDVITGGDVNSLDMMKFLSSADDGLDDLVPSTCLTDQNMVKSIWTISSVNTENNTAVQLKVNYNNDYLGVHGGNYHDVVIYDASGKGGYYSDTYDIRLTYFTPIVIYPTDLVLENVTTYAKEYVVFQSNYIKNNETKTATAGGGGGGGYLSVVSPGKLRIVDKITVDTLFVTNLNQKCV